MVIETFKPYRHDLKCKNRKYRRRHMAHVFIGLVDSPEIRHRY